MFASAFLLPARGFGKVFDDYHTV
ncbi:MAG: hypothetical protein K2H40_14595, partial [Lachnospiraceae bacterium]|nr:hypothetical protein [Lachnospiraceae bacterium]